MIAKTKDKERLKLAFSIFLTDLYHGSSLRIILNKSIHLCLVVITLIATPALSQSTPANTTKSPEKVSLQLKWFNQFQFAGYYAAIEKGYYTQEGLDVEIKERTLDKNFVKQVTAGESEYGVGDSGLLSQYAQGEPVAALAAIFQHNPLVFFSRQDSGIISPQEIAGKRVMSDIISTNDAPLRAMLSGTGISDKDYTLVPQSNNYNLLVQQKIDIISGYLTDQPFFFKEKGLKINFINPQNYGIDFYGDILFTSQKELHEHPGRADRFRRASLKGWRFALDHPEELIQLISKKYHSKLSVEHLRFEAVETRKLILPDVIPIGTIVPERMKLVGEIYANSGFNKPLTKAELTAFIYPDKTTALKLTDHEKAWLAKHPVIRVGIDHDFAPYEWVDKNGHYMGMAADYMQLLEKKLGVHFELIKDKSWAEILNMAKRGELDMLSFAVKTDDRSQYLNFSEPFKAAQTVIVDNGQGNFIGSLDHLVGKRVAIENGYFLQELLQKNHPNIQLMLTTNTREALNLVFDGKADAYIGDAGSVNYEIKKEGLLSLRFSGQTDYRSQHSVAVTKNNPELYLIINKALATFSEDETDAIYNRWLGLNVEVGIRPESLIKYGMTLVLLLLLFGYWAYRMQREITIRKAAEMRELSRCHIMEMLTTDMPLPVVLEAIIKSAEQFNPAMLCSILLMDKEGKHLVSGVAPSLPDYYSEAINGVEIGIGVGSCGTAAFTGELVIVENIAIHPFWVPYKSLAAKAGLGACWSQPIRSLAGNVLGTFAIYHREINTPTRLDIRMIEQLARLASIAIERKQAEEVSQAASQYARSLIEVSLDPLVTISVEGKITDVNTATEKVTGADRASLIGSDFANYFTEPAEARKSYQQAFSQGTVTDYPLAVRHVSGKVIDVHCNASVYKDSNGNVLGVFAAARDVTESRQVENALRIAATAFESQEGMIVTDVNNNILRVNAAFTDITGYSAEEAVGQTPRLLKSGRQDKAFYVRMWECLSKTGAWEGEIWNRRKSGEIYPEHLTITAVKDASGIVTNYVASLTDITLSKAASDEIKNLAFFDPLTKLPNRRLLLDRLKHALITNVRRGAHGALLFIDLDYFKNLNDTLGHSIGDLLLQQVSDRLTNCVREGDTVARIGGDEFVVLLEGLSEHLFDAAAQTELIGNKILTSLNQPYKLASHLHHSTPSIGATLFDENQIMEEDLLKQADIAMYDAKKAGRNTLHFFDPVMQDKINNRAEMERDLRIALEHNEFQLYYQVQVDNDGHALGAEALIRWHHPERGMVSPFHFIPLAEETGLILPIGRWVLETACAQLKAWEQHTLTRNLTISINVSAKQFNQADFVMQVQSVVRNYAINPILLKLELTESMLIDHIDNIIITMVALQAIGVRFELDDFGTGYSSLQYLKKLPLYQLKIDQSFVRDIATDGSDQAIVNTIVAMAQRLNLEVIAEGVETEGQLVYLRNSGCNHFQGYLFGRPVPIDEFEAAL